MTPYKTKEVIEMFAQEYGYDPLEVSIIIHDAYGKIIKQVESLSTDWVMLPAIGGLFIKVWTLKNKINKLTALSKQDGKYGNGCAIKAIRLQEVYDRVTENFYESREKKIIKALEDRATNPKSYDYSHIEGHKFETIRPGTYSYGKGCRCEICKEKSRKYRKEWYTRKNNEDIEAKEQKDLEIEMYGNIPQSEGEASEHMAE